MPSKGQQSDSTPNIEKNIDRYRKSDGTVRVVDADDQPVAGARVSVEQISHEFLFGCNLFYEFPLLKRTKNRTEAAAAEYKRRFVSVFNYAILPFFWSEYEPVRDRPFYGETDSVLNWCQSHNITAKGHPLVWNKEDPVWLPDDPDSTRQLQETRIRQWVKRFRGRLNHWDVINEVVEYNREKYSKTLAPKQSAMWKKAGPVNFAKECFRLARKFNPSATLLINDYVKDERYERLIEQLTDDCGQPLYDAIGIQCHMHDGAQSNEWLWKICDQYAHFGKPLHFSEITILSQEPFRRTRYRDVMDSVTKGEQYQALEATRIYKALFAHPAVSAIVWWDLTDANSWQGAPAGLLRKDMSPKPAYEALRQLIVEKWHTQIALKTGGDGEIRFRGFRGKYRISVSNDSGRETTEEFSLKKDDTNCWVIKLK